MKFERNQIIHGSFIDDLARFRRASLGGGAQVTGLLGVRRSNFTKVGEDKERS